MVEMSWNMPRRDMTTGLSVAETAAAVRAQLPPGFACEPAPSAIAALQLIDPLGTGVQIQAWQAEEIIADVEDLVSRATTEPFTLVLPNVEHDPGALRAAAAAAAASAIVDQLAPFVPREIGLRADGDRIVVQTPDGYGSGQRVGGRRGGDPWSALSAAQDAIAEFLAEPWPASRGEMPMLDASVDPDGGAVVTIDGIPARDWRR